MAESPAQVVLRVAGVSKSFPGTRALQDVDLDVRRGEIHALAGGNGSGKSTLVKILAGVHTPDAGEIHVDAPLHVVHQDPAVFLDMSIADNLALGRGYETDLSRRIRWGAVRRRTADVLERFGIAGRPETPVGALRPSERAMVAVARALQDQEGSSSGVLVLDEPTASLPDPEVELLLDALRRYAAAGQSMLFVSHHVDEVLGFAERVTVLRDGRAIATADTAELDHDGLVELITGRPAERMYPAAPARTEGEAVLDVRGLTETVIRDVAFSVAAGEIVGLAGLVGSGADEILECVFGARAPTAGTIMLDGDPLPRGRPQAAIERGVAYVPGERAHAAFTDMTVRENLSAAQVSRYFTRLFMNAQREQREARATMKRFTIRAASDAQPMSSVSGGNQQKIVLARWLQRRPRLILLEEPTQGVDVGARADIYELIRNAADQGAAVLLAGVDFEEIAGLCDRALVVNEGRIVAELHKPDIDHGTLTELAYKAFAA